jgi:hypothetical protein
MPLLFTKPSQALEVLRRIAPADFRPEYPLVAIQHAIGSVRELTAKRADNRHTTRIPDYDFTFMRSGQCARALLEVEHKTPLDEVAFCSFLLTKHERYGATPLTKWGPLGIVIRIDSKLERYLNMRSNPPMLEDQGPNIQLAREEHDESMEDTLRDILGYCILGYILMNPKAIA